MRITRVFALAALASSLMILPHANQAVAQDDPAAQPDAGKSDGQPLPPAGLGPRKNAPPAQAGKRPMPAAPASTGD